MKSLIPNVILLVTLLLTACTDEDVIKHDYSFTGEGQYWEAEYLYEETEMRGEKNNGTTHSHESKDIFILRYKGSSEEIQSIKRVDYSYETSAGGGGGSREFDEPLTILHLEQVVLQQKLMQRKSYM